MTVSNIALDILNKVATSTSTDKLRATPSEYYNEYLVIPGNNGPRWIIPTSSVLATDVLSQWRPYGFTSRIKWQLLCLLYKLNVLTKLPNIHRITLEPSSINTSHLTAKNSVEIEVNVVPVIYVGTPGPQQKAVVTWIDIKTKCSLAIMKIALGLEAKSSIIKETKVLKYLSEFAIHNVPELIEVNQIKGISLQTVLDGKLSSRSLTNRHISWLLSLPTQSKVTSFIAQKNKLQGIFESSEVKLTKTEVFTITYGINSISSKNTIELILNHGDFTPWNIKQVADHELKVMDWEDANVDGFPLWDLCHFHFIQAHLFNEEKQIDLFLHSMTHHNTLVKRYLTAKNIEIADARQLLLLYILFTVLNKNTSNEYRQFLINKIRVVGKR